jgi:hypothetical protein
MDFCDRTVRVGLEKYIQSRHGILRAICGPTRSHPASQVRTFGAKSEK